MGLEKNDVISVGDDVLTGKYKKDDGTKIIPDLLIDWLELLEQD